MMAEAAWVYPLSGEYVEGDEMVKIEVHVDDEVAFSYTSSIVPREGESVICKFPDGRVEEGWVVDRVEHEVEWIEPTARMRKDDGIAAKVRIHVIDITACENPDGII